MVELARVEALVAEEVERYFTVLLPARIEADFRGNGYEMLWRMLDAHDRRDLVRSTQPPSKRALAMAARVRGACPPHLSQATLTDGSGIVLGRFVQVTHARGLQISAMREVELFPRAMMLLAVPDEDALRAEIALTIFHEYIHYFESFLLRREQPLRGREEGTRVETLDHAEARRRDRRFTRLRVAKWALLGGVMVAILGVFIIQSLPHRPRPAAPVVHDLAAEARAAAAQVASDHALIAHVDEIVTRGLGPDAAIALIGTPPTVVFTPGNESPLVSSSRLAPDPHIPGARGLGPDLPAVALWMHDRDVFPPRLIGVGWSDATNRPVRLDVVIR